MWIMNFDMTTPCLHCPFRKDIPGFITKARGREIARAITFEDKTFTCHQTTVAVEDDDGNCEMVNGPNAQHCAGALILLDGSARSKKKHWTAAVAGPLRVAESFQRDAADRAGGRGHGAREPIADWTRPEPK